MDVQYVLGERAPEVDFECKSHSRLCSRIILVFEGFEHRKNPKENFGNREGNNGVADERSALMPL